MLSRADALEALKAEEWDVVVVGGGVTGAGVALDAASRGYSVAIVERADWASGTSSRSSKMVHGGLRYLQNFDLGLCARRFWSASSWSRWRRISSTRRRSWCRAWGKARRTA